MAFTTIPLLAGIDKFFNILTYWHKYLAPQIPRILHIDSAVLLRIFGGCEIAIALIVLFKPKIGGWIFGIWMAGVMLNVVITPGSWAPDFGVRNWDIFLRDYGLMLAAIAMSVLAAAEEKAQDANRRP